MINVSNKLTVDIMFLNWQLEDVMEKETYKKAKEILEKFDPARFKELEVCLGTK